MSASCSSVARSAGEVAERAERLLAALRGFPVRGADRGGHRGLAEIRGRPVPRFGVRGMVRELADVVRAALVGQPLRAVQHAPMESPALWRRQRRVGHGLDERVPERVDALRKPTGLGEELGRLEPREALLEGLDRQAGDRLEPRQWHLAPDHRRRLQQTLVLRRQPVDPGLDDGVDRVRDRQPGVAAPALAKRARQLLEKERVALGLREDLVLEVRRQRHLAHDRSHDPAALVAAQRMERDLRRPRLHEPGRPVARPVRHEQHDRGVGQVAGQGLEVGLRGRIDPVNVLHRQHDGPPAAEVEQDLAERVEGPGPQPAGIELDPLRQGGEAHQLEQERRLVLGRHREAPESTAQPGSDHLRRIGLRHAAEVPQELDQREVGRQARVGQAVALDVRDPPAPQRLAQLVEEARLPAAGLPGDPDRLARPRRHLREELLQESQLVGAADELAERGAPLPPAPGARRPQAAHEVPLKARGRPRA